MIQGQGELRVHATHADEHALAARGAFDAAEEGVAGVLHADARQQSQSFGDVVDRRVFQILGRHDADCVVAAHLGAHGVVARADDDDLADVRCVTSGSRLILSGGLRCAEHRKKRHRRREKSGFERKNLHRPQSLNRS